MILKKKGEVGLLDFWNGRVKSSLMDPLPSELTTSWIEKKKKKSLKIILKTCIKQ